MSTDASTSSTSSASSTAISDLMQVFSNAATPALSSLLSSSNVQAALSKASPADLVQLSDQALQLQEVDDMFGGGPTTQTSTDPMESLLQTLYTPETAASSSSAASSSASTTPSALAAATEALQSGSLVNLLG